MAIEIPATVKVKARERTKKVENPSFNLAQLNDISFLSKGLTNTKKEKLFREMHLLLQAGVDPRSVLDLVATTQQDKKVKGTLEKLRDQVMKGTSLSEAMAREGSFTAYEHHSVGIGEEGGRIDTVFLQLADHHAEQLKLQRMIKQAFAYPVLVLVITLGVVGFMMSVIVPMFAQVFTRSGAELPAVTEMILNISQTANVWIPAVILLIMAGVIGYMLMKKNEKLRSTLEQLQLRIPLFGALRRKTLMARYCSAMSFLLRSGTPLDRALRLSEQMSGSLLLERALVSTRKDLVQGHTLKHGLSQHALFDQQLVAMVGVAEEVKQLDTMFERLAQRYSNEVQHKTAMLGAILEPVTILVIAVFVGVVLVAMYLPMFKLSTMF